MECLTKCQVGSSVKEGEHDRRSFQPGVCTFCRGTVHQRRVQQATYPIAEPEPCLLHTDLLSLNRPDIPADIEQLLIVVGNQAFLQGSKFHGELGVNTAALRQDASGDVIFMLKLQDRKALPRSAADKLVQQITAIAPRCPSVPRGKSKTALQGWMKCMLERYSRNAGEFGRTRAEQQDDSVANLADAILQGQTDAVSLAFPHLMNQAYRR